MISFLKHFWITTLLSVIILYLCFMNTAPLPKVPMTDFDKLVHFLMFLGMSGCIYFENTRYFKRAVSYQRIVLGSFLFPVVFSGLIELMQEYISPYRCGDWWDFLYDGLGALIGFAVCLSINKKLQAKA